MPSRAIKIEEVEDSSKANMINCKSEMSTGKSNEVKQHDHKVYKKFIKDEYQSDPDDECMKPELHPSSEIEMEEQRSGRVGIVYIGGSLYPGRAPRPGFQYWINKAWSSESTPTIGAQLQRPEGGAGSQLVLCGWVRRRHNSVILNHLNKGRYIRGKVLETEPWMWGEDQCYWGVMEWEIYTYTAEVDKTSTSTGTTMSTSAYYTNGTNAINENNTSASSKANKSVTKQD